MLFQVAALFARAFVETNLIDNGESASYAKDFSYLVVPPILLVLLFPVLRQHRHFLISLIRRHDLTLRLVLCSILLGVALRASYWGGLVSLISFGVLSNSDPQAVVGPVLRFGCPDSAVLTVSFLVMSLLIPATEEAINRGLIIHTLIARGRIPALVLSSALFAIVHDPQAILVAFLGGLFLGMQVIKHRTLWAPLFTHAAYNAVAVIDSECISAQWNPVEMTDSIVGTGLIASALAVVGLALSILLVMQKETGAHERPDVSRS